MNYRLAAPVVTALLLAPAFASANPEPTTYDTRSVGMGLTGTSFLERPAALVMNPANLEGVEKFGFSFNFTNIFTNQLAPVQGPDTQLRSGIGYGPLPSGFLAGRIAPRVVFAGGVYIETGYGSSFSNVQCLDGANVTPDPADPESVGPYVPDTSPATCVNSEPQDLNVTFFVGEFSAGTSIRVHEKFWLGVALRVPFSKQIADLWQNVGAALGTVQYGRVKNDLGGVGFPSPRIGITWKPHRKVTIGAMYRMYSKIRLTGTTQTDILIDPTTGNPLELNSEANWNIPNAFQVGLSYQANQRLLIAFEFRMQFHAAKRTGNPNQTVVASTPDGSFSTTTVVGFGWENALSGKVGVEYRFPIDLLAIRGGINIAKSATSPEWAQYFTPPPGFSVVGLLSAGLGFYFGKDDKQDRYLLDLAGAFSYSGDKLDDQYIGTEATVPGTMNTEILCSSDQVVRTGCPGEIGVFTYFASIGFTLQY